LRGYADTLSCAGQCAFMCTENDSEHFDKRQFILHHSATIACKDVSIVEPNAAAFFILA
jgi:hypothetical protein